MKYIIFFLLAFFISNSAAELKIDEGTNELKAETGSSADINFITGEDKFYLNAKYPSFSYKYAGNRKGSFFYSLVSSIDGKSITSGLDSTGYELRVYNSNLNIDLEPGIHAEPFKKIYTSISMPTNYTRSWKNIHENGTKSVNNQYNLGIHIKPSLIYDDMETELTLKTPLDNYNKGTEAGISYKYQMSELVDGNYENNLSNVFYAYVSHSILKKNYMINPSVEYTWTQESRLYEEYIKAISLNLSTAYDFSDKFNVNSTIFYKSINYFTKEEFTGYDVESYADIEFNYYPEKDLRLIIGLAHRRYDSMDKALLGKWTFGKIGTEYNITNKFMIFGKYESDLQKFKEGIITLGAEYTFFE